MRGAAPPLELRSEDGVFSGAAGAFLIMPESDQPHRLAVHWDFSAAPKNRQGLSTVGFGDARSADAAPPEELQSTYFMGGLLHRQPATPARSGFMAAWQGTPPFDAMPLMTWTESLYGYYLKFFEAPMGLPYAVFLRRNLINAGGGVEIGNSFVVTFGADTDPADLKGTLAHEMLHTFVGHLDSSESFAGSWFSEGLAVYYERLLPLRAGAITSADYLRDINTTAARYFTDALNNTPNDQIGARFWADTRVRVLPYDRGGLYFAVVNDEVRKASQGKRSLDDMVLEMLKGRRAGHPSTEQTWRQIIARELGEKGIKQFDAMLAGELIVPASDAFGTCYERTTAPLRRYELGFTPDVLAEPTRIVRGLIPGSAAARAGLADGDHIVKPVPQDKIQADQDAMLHLQVQRGDKTLDISYLPRGETVDAYQWKAKAGCSATP
jgi:predicted metalloprotease with PDZ domain